MDEGEGVLSQDHIAIVGSRGRDHAGAIAPQILFVFFLGAIGLLLVGALFDPDTAIRVASGLTVFAEAVGDRLARIVFAQPAVRGHGALYIKTVELRRIQMQLKAKLQDEQWMLDEEAA